MTAVSQSSVTPSIHQQHQVGSDKGEMVAAGLDGEMAAAECAVLVGLTPVGKVYVAVFPLEPRPPHMRRQESAVDERVRAHAAVPVGVVCKSDKSNKSKRSDKSNKSNRSNRSSRFS